MAKVEGVSERIQENETEKEKIMEDDQVPVCVERVRKCL
jgi:hypothetical protein